MPRLAIALCISLLGLVGCVGAPTATLYQLDAGQPALPQAQDGVAVLLGPVVLADYLQREVLLQRQTDGNLTVASEGRWAGSLSADVERLLLRQLAAQLDSQRVQTTPVAGFKPDVQVLLTITRLDSGPKQPAILQAQWRLLDSQGLLRDSRLVSQEQPHDGLLASQVQAQSQLLQQLAKALALAIQALPAPVPASPPAASKPPRKPAVKGPQTPVVDQPARGPELLSF